MNAEIVTTGTEILLGEIVDTNAAWLARRLRELGINVYHKTTVGDNLERITAVLRQGLERSDLVLVTGGLGPTVDDVTRDAAALATDRHLVLDETCLAYIEAIFARWGRRVHDNNRRQALLPASAKPILNPVGTAPGFIVESERKARPSALLICLPGVPREMKHLMQETVEPFLADRLGSERVYIRSRTLRTVGIGESMIDSRIADLMARSNPTVGLAAHLGQVDVRITARAATAEQADQMLDVVAADLRTRLGDFIYGEGEVTLEAVVAADVRRAGYTLAVVETNTGGEIAARLRSTPDGEQAVPSSAVVASLLEMGAGAPEAQVSKAGAEWAAAVRLAAARESLGVSLAMAVCGDMEPSVGPYGARRGETYVALAAEGVAVSTRLDVGGVDELARRWVGNGALNFLRQWLAQRAETPGAM
jgi:nicotinamide-nucleotide amidase